MHKHLSHTLGVFGCFVLMMFTVDFVQAQPMFGRLVSALVDGEDGRTLEVTVQLRSNTDPAFNLGPSSFQLEFNNQALSMADTPVKGEDGDYQYLTGFDTPFYNNSTVTRPDGNRVSLNIFIFAPSAGTPVSNTDYVDLAVLRFKVTDVTQMSELTWVSCEYSDDTFTIQSDPEDGCNGFEDDSVVLPVELKDMGVELQNGHGLLHWRTLSESENAGFQIEAQRRLPTDLANALWQPLGFVAGAGTTAEPQSYTFQTPALDPGTHRFRLKQIDFDGTFAYSETVELAVGVVGRYLLKPVYPNPFTTAQPATISFAVSAPQQVYVRLYDATGRLARTLFSGLLPADQTQALGVFADGLASGTYLLRLEGETFQAHRTLTLVK